MHTITGETPTFETFYARYYRLVYHLFSRLDGSERASLDDLVQETFLKAWKAYDRLDHPQNVNGWIRRIAQHVLCDFFAANQQRSQHECPLEIDGELLYEFADPHGEKPMRVVDESDAMEQAYHRLSLNDQRVLTLLAQRSTVAEMAQTFHINPKACQKRIDNARRRFQRSYFTQTGEAYEPIH